MECIQLPAGTERRALPVSWPVRGLSNDRIYPRQASPSLSSGNKPLRNSTHPHASPQVTHGYQQILEILLSSTWVQSLATILRHPDGLGGGPLRHVPFADGARLLRQFDHRTGSKLMLTSCNRSSATMNSQRVPIARPMARTVSTSPWKVPHTAHWPPHLRDVRLGGRSEANQASQDREHTLRRRPGKATRRMPLPRKRTATRPLRPRMTILGPNNQKPQPISHGPIAGMYPES